MSGEGGGGLSMEGSTWTELSSFRLLDRTDIGDRCFSASLLSYLFLFIPPSLLPLFFHFL